MSEHKYQKVVALAAKQGGVLHAKDLVVAGLAPDHSHANSYMRSCKYFAAVSRGCYELNEHGKKLALELLDIPVFQNSAAATHWFNDTFLRATFPATYDAKL